MTSVFQYGSNTLMLRFNHYSPLLPLVVAQAQARDRAN